MGVWAPFGWGLLGCGGDGVGEPAGWCAALVKYLADAPRGGIDGHAEMCADGGTTSEEDLADAICCGQRALLS